MRPRMSDPSGLIAGGLRGSAAGTPAEADVILRALLDNLQENNRLIKQQQRRQRMKLETMQTRIAYVQSHSRAEFRGGTFDRLRVTYIYAFVGGGAAVTGTLHLKGGAASGDTFAIPIPNSTQPPLLLEIGDAETGGLLLDFNDAPYIDTSNGSSQLIVGILAGEIMQDSFLTLE